MKPAGQMFKDRKSLGEEVFEYLRNAIIDQTIEPGTILVESSISDMLNISRTPLREALHKLEKEDWIEKNSSGSFQVIILTSEDIEQTFGIRSVLEAYAARLATENYTPVDFARLEAMVAEYKTCLDNDENENFFSLLTEFHAFLYQLSKNSKLIKMIDQLCAKILMFRQIILKQNRFAKESWRDHVRMMDAMRTRDADRVEKLVREHILRGKKAVLQGFKQMEKEKKSA